jgi:octaprenyl-diphosphate synthase
MREGKLTLPVIHSLAAADEKDRKRMIRIIQNKNFSKAEFQDLVGLLNQYSGIDYTRRKAAEHIRLASEALAVFDDCPPKEILNDIAQYAMLRNM